MADTCEGIFSHGVCLESLKCRYIMQVARGNRCSYAADTVDCHSENTFFQYMKFLACKCNETDNQMYYCSLIFLFHLSCYFLIMILLAEFFTPSLCYVSNVLGMSENLAGATLLALGNGAPDLMTTMVEATTLGPEIVLIQVLGTCVHVTTFVMGMVILSKTFSIKPWPFVRTVFPVPVVLIVLFTMYGNGIVTLWQSLTFLIMFIVYLAMYCLQECCMKDRKTTKRKSDERKEHSPEISGEQAGALKEESDEKINTVKLDSRSSLTGSDSSLHPVSVLLEEMVRGARTEEEQAEVERRKSTMERMGIELPPQVIVRDKPATHSGGITAALQVERQQGLHMLGLDEQAREESVGNPKTIGVEIEGQVVYWKSKGMWKDFCRHMVPIDEDFWMESKCIHKVIHLIEAPLLYAMKLFIPCVHEGVLCNNWCKLLACIHCFTVPMVFLWTFSVWKMPFLEFVIIISIAGGLAVVAIIIVLIWSAVRRAPCFHIAFAFVGIIVTIVVMYVIVNEVVAIVRAMGSIYGLSTPLLCITVLPWGNGIEDLMNGIHLAHAGYATMAFAGSYGTAFLVVVVGMFIGTLFIVVFSGTDNRYTYVPTASTLVYTALAFALFINVTTLVAVPTLNFTMKKFYGLFLIMADAMFIVICVMIEAQLF